MAQHQQRHISGWPAILLAPIAIPVILAVQLLQKLHILKSTADLEAPDVEKYLRDFLDGGGGEWDWDDFTSIPITDPTLESIREQAAWVALPLDNEGRATLEHLLAEVEMLITPPPFPERGC